MEEKDSRPDRPKKKKARHARGRSGPGTAAVFFVVLGLVTALAWVLPLRPTMSEKEKRELEKFPEFSLSTMADGSYFRQIGLWFSDTFPGRDLWIRAAQAIDRLHGSSDIVIYGQLNAGDMVPVVPETPTELTVTPAAETPAPTPEPEPEGTASQETETPVPETPTPETPTPEPTWGGIVIDQEDLVSIGATVQIGDRVFNYPGFSQYYADMYAASLNRAAELLDGKARVFNVFVLNGMSLLLPRDFRESLGCALGEDVLEYVFSQTSDKVYDVDTYNSLLPHNGEYIYFRTDHHWTALGAYYAYVEWAKMAGVEPVSLDEYEEVVQEPFQGSLFYQANQSSKLRADQVYGYVPPGDVHLYIVNGAADSVNFRGYEEDLIKQIHGGDKYLCFLTGDLPLCTFINNDITDGSACLIVKNSDGNPFCYYFTQHYQYVYVLDYRKYFQRSLTNFVDYYDVDDVIFCLSDHQAMGEGSNSLINGLVR